MKMRIKLNNQSKILKPVIYLHLFIFGKSPFSTDLLIK